ncbi:hypothetical protein [Paraburkholderia diazotrophica]|uniref:Uncharacterized protein n=1 Tax=Paraburkholderia diazotrophica TaxID=667676 RepID=A0A1H6XX03_9BURK|nr:hypothetical protein [Paraburkholderia diazotrophica]SEJ33598.1 hypothetical protein SAMN05192539_1009141 [Paraburkholderia diazotrophica]
MPTRDEISLYRAAERAVVALYDGGVLSPAVLERVLTAFIGAKANWNAEPQLRSADDHTLHEIVAMTMMPGRAPRNAARDFAQVIAHIGSAGTSGESASDAGALSAHTNEDEEGEAPEHDDTLEQQLGAARRSPPKRSKQRARPASGRAAEAPADSPAPKGFNPFLNAKPPRKR